jgi:hypothetical protein
MDTMARMLATRICAFDPIEMRAVSAARELSLMDPERSVLVLDALVTLAREGGLKERLALDAVGRAILKPPIEQLSRHHLARTAEAADELGLPAVLGLFIAPPPAESMDELGSTRSDPSIAHLTLGHKKMLARSANPDLLARLAAEGEPSVVKNILLNSRLTESLVVRICAKRPIRTEVLRAVYNSRRWSALASVRRAMVQNPFCEPELALKILPTLDEKALQNISRTASLHPAVKEAALRLRQTRSKKRDEV